MRMLVGFVGSIVSVFALAACGASTAPTAPAAAPVSPNGFGMITESSASAATLFSACLSGSGVASCFSAPRIHGGNVTASAATAPSMPLNLVASSSGSSVTLTWSAPSTGDAVTTYIIEAGSAPGLANLANFSTGNTLTIFQASGIGAGAYYVRLRAANPAGTSAPSNEAILVVGGSPSVAPGAPSGLTNTVNAGGTLAFAWNAASGSPTSYIIEAGSQPGLANLANSDLGSAATTMTASGVGAGTYYVRVRAKNAFGISAPSNEVVVIVGVAGSNFSGKWSGTYTVTSCNAGAAGGPVVGPIICGSALRAGTTLPITLSLSQNGTAVSGSVLFGSSGTSSLNGTIGATGALGASGSGTYSASGVSFRVLIGGFTATTDGTRLTATWGEFISQTGVSVLSGSADVRLRTLIVMRTP